VKIDCTKSFVKVFYASGELIFKEVAWNNCDFFWTAKNLCWKVNFKPWGVFSFVTLARLSYC